MVKLEDVDGIWEILHRRIRRIQILVVKGIKHCGFKSMVYKMKVANGLRGMVKYAVE